MPSLYELAKIEMDQDQNYDYFLQVDGHELPFPSGSVIVVGGRPGMGKTTLLLHLFLLLSEKYNERQLYLSGDSTATRLYQKIKSIVTRTPFEVLHLLGIDPIDKYPILSNESCKIESIGRQWDLAKELILSSDAKFIFLDNIQLLFPQTAPKQQYEANLSLLKELKYLATDHQKVIILASQLSRKLESRSSKKPKITDFYPNEPLEEIADIVMMLYRPDYYGHTDGADGVDIRNQAILSLVKSNYSPLFEMMVEFDKSIPCFINI